jgi:hypothetical protein
MSLKRLPFGGLLFFCHSERSEESFKKIDSSFLRQLTDSFRMTGLFSGISAYRW